MNKPFYKKSQFWLLIFLSLLLLVRFSMPTVEKEEKKEIKEKNLTHVRTELYQAKDFVNQLKLYANTTPIKHSELVSKYSGEIVEIYYKQGDKVKSGDHILKIRDNDLTERLETAKLALEEAKLEYNSALKLKENKLISELVFIGKQTDLKRAEADYKNAFNDLEDSIVKAHFDGEIENFDFQIGDYVLKDQVVATLSDLTQLKTYVHIPEKHIFKILKGSEVSIQFPNNTVKGYVNYIPKVGNQDTHTFKTEIITNKYENLISGLTAPIYISLPSEKAFLISPSYLGLMDNGTPSVKIVVNDTVKIIPIEILNRGDNGIWVRSLNENYKESLNIITIGHILVNDGTKVKHSSSKDK